MKFGLGNTQVVLVGVASLVLVCAVGCVGSPRDSTGPGSDPDPLTGAPQEGTCHRLSEVDVYGMSIDAANASCDGAHNSYTYHVGVLANDDGELPGVFARRECRALLPDVLGLPLDVVLSTVFDVATFQASVDQEEAGASWYRCELVAHAEEWAFKELPSGRPPYFASTDVPDSYLACADASRANGVRLPCDMPHTHQWAGSFTGPTRMPTGQGLRRLAGQRCPGIANTEYWYAAWPLQREWDAGFRVISCYSYVNKLPN